MGMTGIDNKIFGNTSGHGRRVKTQNTFISAKNILAKTKAAFSMPVLATVAA